MNVCVLRNDKDLANKPMNFSVQDVCQIMEHERDQWEQKKGFRRKQDRYEYARIYLDPKFTWNLPTFKC